MRWVALVAAMAILAGAQTGLAAAGRVSAVEQQRARLIAERYWGETDCVGRIAIRYRPAGWPVLAYADYDYIVGTSVFVDCAVEFNSKRVPGLGWPRYCATMVHEFGHLAGRGHSADPRSVMYPQITRWNIPRVCEGS